MQSACILTRERLRNGCIVYDCDDTLFDLIERTLKKLSISPELMRDFHLENNEGLTTEMMSDCISLLHSPQSFKDIEFYPGVENIMRPYYEFGVPVIVNSNSSSIEIQNLKIEQLCAKVPGFKPEFFVGKIITQETYRHKDFDPKSCIVCDDSPYSVSYSPAQVNILPMKKWNMTLKSLEVMVGKPVCWRMSLVAIENLVYHIVREVWNGGETLNWLHEIAEPIVARHLSFSTNLFDELS